jgi:hypothetical protein
MFFSIHELPTSARPFLRFVVGAENDDIDELSGLFQFDGVDDDSSLAEWERTAIEEAYAWFNAHLKVPPFGEISRYHRRTCWFRSDAGEHIRRMWELVALMRHLGWPVRFVWTHDPGQLVYYDQHQVVARRSNARHVCSCVHETSISRRGCHDLAA